MIDMSDATHGERLTAIQDLAELVSHEYDAEIPRLEPPQLGRDELERAKTEPWPVIRTADARHDDPDWGVVGFDKAWGGMQGFFLMSSDIGRFRRRPAYDLVAGDVHYVNAGEYTEYIGLLTAETVREIARDLAQVTDAEIDDYAGATGGHHYAKELRHYISIAKRFVTDAAHRNHCIAYMIW